MKRLLLFTHFATLSAAAFSQTHYTFVDEEIIGRNPSGAIIDKGQTTRDLSL